MGRRSLARVISLPLGLLAAMSLAAAVAAGGWAEVTVTDPPVDPSAGTGTTIGLKVMQHGVTPVSWPAITVVATDKVSGQAIRTDATPEGAEGRYVATVTFPSAGAWTLTFESRDLQMSGFANVQVGPTVVPAAPPAGEPATATSTAGTPVDPAIWLGISALAALAVGLLIASLRGRRATTVSG